MSPLHKLMLKGGVDRMTKKELDALIGMNIKREREKVGLTQERFSEMIGCGPKNLSAVERGVVGISMSTLRRICQTLSISSDQILFGEMEKGDVQVLASRLENLSPRQLELVSEAIYKLMEAFALPRE